MNLVYKKVLILSDNIEQCVQYYKLIQTIGVNKEVSFGWGCSIYSDANIFKKRTGLVFTEIDLRDELQVKRIIDTYSLVISMHCKQLFPYILVTKVKCINVHPGYNPINRGWYPQVFSIIHNTIIGATIHEIDEEVDHGNIIDRMEVTKYAWDTSLEIYNRVLAAELILLGKNLINILSNNYQTLKPEIEGILYLKKDFKQLCKIDLETIDKFETFFNKLRALSHKPYKNAYFIDKETGKKIFINIQLEVSTD